MTGLFWQQSADDVSQFDSKFTSQTPVDSPDDSTLSESANQVFLVSNYLFTELPNKRDVRSLAAVHWLMGHIRKVIYNKASPQSQSEASIL